ncbi:MAG: AI-2E family transporter [bacterium]
MDRLSVEISWTSLWRILLMGVFVVSLYLMREAIIAVLLAIFISIALDSLVQRLVKWHIPRPLGTVLVFVTVLSIAIMLLSYAVPIVIVELRGIFQSFGSTAAQIFNFDSALQVRIIDVITMNLDKVTNFLRSGDLSLFEIVQKVMGGASFVFAVLVLSFYLTASQDGVARFLRAIFPVNLEDKVLSIYYRSKRKIEYWVRARLILGVVVGIMVFLGLWFGGIRYSLLIAFIAGIFELVPIIGPILAGAIGVIVAIAQSPSLGIFTLLLFLGVEQIENHVLVPLVVRKAIDMHPVVILVALLGGYQIGGITGMLLSAPAAIVLQELIDDWMETKSRDRAAMQEGK